MPDSTVGHNDSHSLRIDGLSKAWVRINQHVVEQNADKWWVRGWYKSTGVGGRGLQLRVRYPFKANMEQLFYLGGRGDCDWTYFSFVTDVLKTRDITDISIELDGPGTAWIDDFALSAILDGKMPKTTSFKMPTDLEPRTDMLIDLAMTEKPACDELGRVRRGVYDASHNGHHLILEGGSKWMREGKRGFLQLDGIDDGGEIPLRPVMEPRGRGHNRRFPLDAFSYEVWLRPRKPTAQNPKKRMIVFRYRHNPIMELQKFTDTSCTLYDQNDLFKAEKLRLEHAVPLSKWSHVVATHAAGKMTLYINGKPVASTPYDPKAEFLFFAYKPRYVFGFRVFDKTRQFHGDLGPFRLHTKALTADEVAERFRTGS